MKKPRTGGDGALGCAEVIKWRKAERQRLIAERLAIPGDIRRRHSEQIAASLDEVIGEVHGRVISAYWPFRGEPDLRGFMGRVSDRGGRCALPVVVEREASGISQCLQAPRKSCRYSDRARRRL